MLRATRAIARSGVTAVLLHPLRSATAVACVVAVLVPYICGTAIARGARGEARAAIDAGPDLHLVRTRFGRPVPAALAEAESIRALPGVREVVPRIVGELALGIDLVPVVLIGMPVDRLPAVEGSAPEFRVGAELARRLGLKTGSYLPPFYHGSAGDRVSRVVGVLPADGPPASANVMFTSLATAAEVFAESGFVTDFLVHCQPGYVDAVREKLSQGETPFRITTRAQLHAQLPASLRHLDGVFQILFLLAFAVGIPLLLVASGVGLAERRREAALLKATGWMTDQLLLRAFAESTVICLLASSVAVIIASAWLALGNARGVAAIFLPGLEFSSAMRVPYQLGFEGTLVATVLSLCIVATGSLYSTWRVATTPARLVLR